LGWSGISRLVLSIAVVSKTAHTSSGEQKTEDENDDEGRGRLVRFKQPSTFFQNRETGFPKNICTGQQTI